MWWSGHLRAKYGKEYMQGVRASACKAGKEQRTWMLAEREGLNDRDER